MDGLFGPYDRTFGGVPGCGRLAMMVVMGDLEQTSDLLDVFCHGVNYVEQPTPMSCWAASLAMIAGYETAEELAKALNLEHALANGIQPDELEAAVAALGLRLEPGSCGYPSMLANWLTDYGPIMVLKDMARGFHAVVIAGISGDGTMHGSWLTQADPWNGIHRIWYSEFAKQYEGGSAITAHFIHR